MTPRVMRNPRQLTGRTAKKPKPSTAQQCNTCGHNRKEHRWGTKGCKHVEVAYFAFGVVPVSRCACEVFA